MATAFVIRSHLHLLSHAHTQVSQQPLLLGSQLFAPAANARAPKPTHADLKLKLPQTEKRKHGIMHFSVFLKTHYIKEAKITSENFQLEILQRPGWNIFSPFVKRKIY
jgi:hypothetical protein